MTPADTMRAAVEALEGAEQWLEGWASAEPYLSRIRSALSLLRSALEQGEPEPVAWYCPVNKDPGQSATFEKARRDKWPHLYPVALYTASIPPNTPVEAGKVGVASGVMASDAPGRTDEEILDLAESLHLSVRGVYAGGEKFVKHDGHALLRLVRALGVDVPAAPFLCPHKILQGGECERWCGNEACRKLIAADGVMGTQGGKP